ncbi:S-adenosyl-L-methionine-dependent methyltransferase, partial [Halenospora varia]
NHRFENGRRYHKFREGRYPFPNDESEQDREDMKHAMIVNLCGGKLHFAPIGDNPQDIIDLGTGTGIWCVDMGDEYPSANILGVDLSPIQQVWVPPNVRFMVDDIEETWLESADFYDLVHGRHITPAIKDFPALLRRAYKHTKPGGWVEFQEMHHLPHCDDDTMPADYPLTKFFRVVAEGLRNMGVSLDASRHEAANLEAYGFVNVRHEVLKIPIGTWPKHKTLKMVGLYGRTGIFNGLQAMALGPLCRGMGWSKTQVEVMLVDVRRALEDSSVHCYLPFHVMYGMKPLDAKGD